MAGHDGKEAAIGLVIQARMSSIRLPGKVLRPMAGKPMLGWLLERMLSVDSVTRVVVATSRREDDAGIVEYAQSKGAASCRGELDDVLSRFLEVVKKYQFDAVVRVSGDSPFLDPAIVREAVQLYRDSSVDLVTNVFPRSFPKGQSVEVISRSAMERAAIAANASEKEHVTAHFYAHPNRYRIRNFLLQRSRAEIQMAVDTEADFAFAERMLLAMRRPALEYDLEALLELRSGMEASMTARKES